MRSLIFPLVFFIACGASNPLVTPGVSVTFGYNLGQSNDGHPTLIVERGGVIVRTLVNERQAPGRYQVQWDAPMMIKAAQSKLACHFGLTSHFLMDEKLFRRHSGSRNLESLSMLLLDLKSPKGSTWDRTQEMPTEGGLRRGIQEGQQIRIWNLVQC